MDTTAIQLKAIYEDTLSALSRHAYEEERSNSLLKGPWGALMFLFYYERYADDTADEASDWLETLYEAFRPDKGVDYSYCNGHTGPFWLLQHLHRHEFIDIDTDYLISDFIGMAIARSQFLLAADNFDFLHGTAGICNFLTAFADRAAVREHLEEFVHKLMAVSKETPQGRSLPVLILLEPGFPEGIDAFSLAHGNCALLILLAKIHQAGIAQTLCEQLIRENIAYTLQQEHAVQDNATHSLFPGILADTIHFSRLSWCYGDLNVALALWYCGKTFSNEDWKQEALRIMHYNIRRDSYETAGIADTCLCHGAGGIAAFYRRFWQETQDTAFLDCALHWHQQTLAQTAFAGDDTTHGIKVWAGDGEEWTYCWDLLNGSCGVGLSILSHEYPAALTWDELLLLS